jgi:hypothetical protein
MDGSGGIGLVMRHDGFIVTYETLAGLTQCYHTYI